MLSTILDFALAFGGLAMILGLSWFFIAGFFRSPFVPSNIATVERLLQVAKIKRGEKLVDLGCGDGRIVVRAERYYGAIATGYEISILVWLLAQLNLRLWRSHRAQIYRANLFQADISKADIVTCYLLPRVMQELLPKFRAELKPGARVVSAAFRMHAWRPTREYPREGSTCSIFVYTQPRTKVKVRSKKAKVKR